MVKSESYILRMTPESWRPFDTGPIYYETHHPFHPWLIEPWNTISNLAFLALLLYWLPRARGDSPFARYLRLGVPILAVGWAGGTLYHGWRSWELWHMLDYFPILFLVGWTATWFWRLVGNRFATALGFAAPLLAVPLFFADPRQSVFLGSLTYFILAVAMMTPVALLALRRPDRSLRWFVLCLCFLFSAILLRGAEDAVAARFEVGTHFLWHLFGAIACHFMMLHLQSVAEA